MANPQALKNTNANRSQIEAMIMMATPGSLVSAQNALSAKTNPFSADETTVLNEIIRGISIILYPEPASGKNAAPVPFYVEQLPKNVSEKYTTCLAQLVEASQGKTFVTPAGTEGDLLTELLPALAIFRSQKNEISENAVAIVTRFEQAGGKSVITDLVKAKNAYLTKDYTTAFTEYSKITKAYPDVWPAGIGLGKTALKQDKPLDASAILGPLASSRANDPDFIVSYALSVYGNGNFADAEPILKKALVVDPQNAAVLLAAAHIALFHNDYMSASRYLDACSRLIPQDKMYLFLKTKLSLAVNRFDDAIRWARNAMQLYPSDPEIMVNLSETLFKGPTAGRAEAIDLAKEADRLFALPESDSFKAAIASAPLLETMRTQAKEEAVRLLVMDAYDHQDWKAAQAYLGPTFTANVDKNVVATILLKSDQLKQALAFTSTWFRESSGDENAIEAYLRALVAARASVASAQSGTSDVSTGIINMFGSSSATGQGDSTGILNIVLQLMSGTCTSQLRSFLYYMYGSMQASDSDAVKSYQQALIERADNVEAMIALAKIYAGKNDKDKAMFYIKQARDVGIQDKDLATEASKLAVSLGAK
jgi:tetratricopeptide (TPR) repeat protein